MEKNSKANSRKLSWECMKSKEERIERDRKAFEV